MADSNTDLIYTKLTARYGTGKSINDLWQEYWDEFNSGKHKFGKDLLDHYGGTGSTIADREFAFWDAWDPNQV